MSLFRRSKRSEASRELKTLPSRRKPDDVAVGEAGVADVGKDPTKPHHRRLPRTAPRFEVPDTPFVAGDPSIERIVDEEETAANGEMFKDARLQERLFDQIHAVEFNMEDDFRKAEVGSLFSSGLGLTRSNELTMVKRSEPIREERRPEKRMYRVLSTTYQPTPCAAAGFQRISDDEEEAR